MDLKKSALALLALGLTGVASAGGFVPPPACSNHPVTVPCERTAWDLGFTAYWARPTNEYLNYGVDTVSTDGLTTHDAVHVKPKYKFGFTLEGSYHWSTGNDLTVNWTRYHRSFDGDHTYADGSIGAAEARFNFDSVNVELGQHIDVGPNWDVRVHFGGQYMRLDHTIASVKSRSVSNLQNGTFTTTSSESDFDGFGPRTGLDAKYNLSNGFGIVARSAVSLLVGDIKAKGATAAYEGDVLSTETRNNYWGRRVVVVGVDSRVGLSYTASMSQGSVTGEVGYFVTSYQNPIISNLGDSVSGESSHFGLNGVYGTLKYVS